MSSNICTKIKSFFGRPKAVITINGERKSSKELFSQVFQDYLKIKADLQVSDIKVNGGINFKVSYQGSIVPFWLSANSGITEETAKPKIQEALTTIAVGLAIGLNLVEISQSLKELTSVIK